MKTLRQIMLLSLIAFAFSCTKKTNEYDISFLEKSFPDNNLATITILNDSMCVVGGENGEIYLLKDSQEEEKYMTKLARVYCLYTAGDTLYAGVRNSGLCRIVKSKNQLETTQYSIARKDTKYSPYSIIPYRGDILIVATSNGLFSFSKKTENVLDSIHYGAPSGEPFVFCSPINIGNFIFLGTSEGVVKIDKTKERPEVEEAFLKNEVVSKIEKGDHETIYALSQKDTLYLCDIKDESILKKYPLPFHALSFVKGEGKFYFVSERELYVIDNIDKIEDRVIINLPHKVATDARNLIVNDYHANKIRIVTQKSILALPTSNGIGESESKIYGSCFDKENRSIYFINSKMEIFEYKEGDCMASKIIKLSPTEDVTSLSASNGTIYYISNHQQLKSIKDHLGLGLLNPINSPHIICKDLLDKSTAMLIDGSVAYVAVRDTLLSVDLTHETLKPIIQGRDVKPYVTSIKKRGEYVYASTLNDGLFIIDCDTIHNKVQFQNDFEFNVKDILLLTNHNLLYYKDHQKDSVVTSLSGYDRLLFNEMCKIGAAISKNEIQFFKIEKDSIIKLINKDSRQINPQACLMVDTILYLAADEGMLKVKLTDVSSNDIPYNPVHFDNKEIAWTETIATIAAIIIILLVLFVILKKKEFARNLKKRLLEAEDQYKLILFSKEERLRKEHEIHIQEEEEKHQLIIDDMNNSHKKEIAVLNKEEENLKKEYDDKLKQAKEEHQQRLKEIEDNFKKNREEEIKKQTDSLRKEIRDLLKAMQYIDDSLKKDNDDFDAIKNTTIDCKLYLQNIDYLSSDVYKLGEKRKIIISNKLKLNELLVGSINRVWEFKLVQFFSKDKIFKEKKKAAVGACSFNERIKFLKNCDIILNKLNTICIFKALSSINIYSNDIDNHIQSFESFDKAIKEDDNLQLESIINEVYSKLLDMDISKVVLIEHIKDIEYNTKKVFWFMNCLTPKDNGINSEIIDRLIDVTKRNKIIDLKLSNWEEHGKKIVENIIFNVGDLGKEILEGLKFVEDEIEAKKSSKPIAYLHELNKLIILHDRINMYFLLELISLQIKLYDLEPLKEKNGFADRQDEWSKLINKTIEEFYSIVKEHGTDKEKLFDYGGSDYAARDFFTNHKDPEVKIQYRLLLLTMAIGRFIDTKKEKKILSSYLNSKTTGYKLYEDYMNCWRKAKEKLESSILNEDPTCVVAYYLRSIE